MTSTGFLSQIALLGQLQSIQVRSSRTVRWHRAELNVVACAVTHFSSFWPSTLHAQAHGKLLIDRQTASVREPTSNRNSGGPDIHGTARGHRSGPSCHTHMHC